MDPRWKQPFTCVLAGATGSGKTYFVTQFLNHVSEMMTPLPQEIVWCCGKWQQNNDRLKGVAFAEGIPNREQCDDLMSETDERVTKLFTKGSHRRNLSIMYIVQNLFGKNKRAADDQFKQPLFCGV